MSRAENRRIMERLIDEVWNKRNLEVADELYAPGATCPSAPQLPPGPEGVKAVATMTFAAFPDFKMEIDLLVAGEDRVCAHFMQHGTQQAEFFGMPARGKHATWGEMSILRIENGKVVETWFETDLMTMMKQLTDGSGS